MRLTRVVLTALAVAVCLPSVGSSKYAPQWRVGDWWIVKTWQIPGTFTPEWTRTRYEVTGVEKVHDRDCFVLKAQDQDAFAVSEGRKVTYYVRTDSWLVVMGVWTSWYNGGLRTDTSYTPRGRLGLFRGDPGLRLPRFPLRIGDISDTTFKTGWLDGYPANLREISRAADSEIVKHLLADGVAAGERVVRPAGVVYQVHEEIGNGLEYDSVPGAKSVMQSLQLWCPDQPWRLYEEVVNYYGLGFKRHVLERSWLIASGHKGK
jgi:hypothetical protein